MRNRIKAWWRFCSRTLGLLTENTWNHVYELGQSKAISITLHMACGRIFTHHRWKWHLHLYLWVKKQISPTKVSENSEDVFAYAVLRQRGAGLLGQRWFRAQQHETKTCTYLVETHSDKSDSCRMSCLYRLQPLGRGETLAAAHSWACIFAYVWVRARAPFRIYIHSHTSIM